MASLLRILLEFLRRLRLAKDHIKRFPRRWTSLLAYLVRKMGEWWPLWPRPPSKPGTVRNHKPAEPSFPSDRAGSSSMSGGSVCTGGVGAYVVAASTVPSSANLPLGRERADPQSDTAPPTRTLPTLSVDPPLALGPRTTNQTVGSSNANHSSGNLSVQSRASSRLSMISNSCTSLRAPVQNNRPSQDPRATSRQFGPGPVASRSRSRSSRSPSPKPSLNTAQPDNLDIAPMGAHTFARADEAIDPTNGLEGRADLPSSSHTQEEPGRAAIRRQKQRTTNFRWDIQNPSTDSLSNTPINAQEITEEPMAMDMSPHSSLHTLLSDRAETASQNSHTASFAASVFVLPENRIVQLIISEQIPRYTKNATISREGKLKFVGPLTTIFLHFPDPNTPDQPSLMRECRPWIPATHPDGALYFYDPERRLFTDTDMHDHTLREELEHFYYYLKKIERDELLTIPSENYDLVLDLTLDRRKKMQWSYYYACHDTRCLFWLEEYDATHITSELDGVESPAHLKHRLEDLYWNHWSLFPVVFEGRSLPLSVYDELMGILTHGCIDVMTSRSSTLPYDDDQMQKMITLVQKAKEARCGIGSVNGVNIAGGVGSISNVSAVSNAGGMEHYTAATSRLLSFFAHWRFLYFHGQRHARLFCDQTAYDTTKRKRSALVTLLSPLLFFAPEVHLMEMDKLWTDEVIIERAWKSFMTKLLSEWNDLILWSTVMLAVDVGFLVIPGVVPYNLQNGVLTITPQMTVLVSISEATTIISLGASVGSIVIGLLLMRHNRTKQEVEPAAAWDYLFQTSQTYFGLELMAIVFSLPWALLMWSMLTFYTGLFCYCWSIPKHGSRIAIASVSGVLLAFFWVCVWTIRASSDKRSVWLDGLLSPIIRALRALHLSCFHNTAMLIYKCFLSYRTNDADSEHGLP